MTRTNHWLVLMCGAAACISAGCEGSIDELAPPEDIEGGPEVITPGSSCDADGTPAPLHGRRLTATEYTNSVTDLLGLEGEHGSFIRPALRAGFIGVSLTLSDVTELSAYDDAARQLADRAVAELNPGEIADATFVEEYLRQTARRAYRRPLRDEDVARMMGTYNAGVEAGTPQDGVAWVLHMLLASPHFIYVIERGMPEANEDGSIPLSPHERATRLSYFLTGSFPDDMLSAEADAGTLDDQAVRRHAARLLETRRGIERMNQFIREWLGLDSISTATDFRLDDFGPEHPETRAELRESIRRTIDSVLLSDDPSLSVLLQTRSVFVTEALATSWGIPVPALDGDGWGVTEVPEELRVGILTHPVFIALHSTDGFANASIRGHFMNSKILCREIPEPTADVFDEFPEFELAATDRETLETLHLGDEGSSCYACHVALDPPGFAFENYDSLGRFRTTQENIPGNVADIDASGVLRVDNEDSPYANAEELTNILAQSEQVRACFVRHAFEFAFSRYEETDDMCTLENIHTQLPEGGGTIPEMFVEIAMRDSFFVLTPDALEVR